MTRVLLVDDHAMIREALRMVLDQAPDVEVVGEAGDGAAALALADELDPDLVIMDISLPGMSGIETTRRLRESKPDIKVLALSTHAEYAIIQQMLDLGANGYISKSEAGVELLRGIRNVSAGRTYLCPNAAMALADGLRGHAAASPTESAALTARETQVAALLAQGKTAAEVAVQLNISPNTVDVHRRNLMRKLGLHSVVDLTRYAIRTGLVAP